MTVRGFCALFFGAVLLLIAFSVGSIAAFLLGVAALCAWGLSLLCMLCALCTCRVTQEIGVCEVLRGETCGYTLSVRALSPLPLAPASLRFVQPSGREGELRLSLRTWRTTRCSLSLPCSHVGTFSVGATMIELTDCFGLFTLRRCVREAPRTLCVLPRPAQTAPVSFSPGEGESQSAQRALADHATPDDVRAWQTGDELKRVHWKLSMRRQALMVRTYETPQRTDALILLNSALPEGDDAKHAVLRDALTETCCGLVKGLLEAERITRVPLPAIATEFSGQRADVLIDAQRALAQLRFDQPLDFARALQVATRRMRRTGATVILSAELTPPIADAAMALSRMGPRTRFTLVTCGEVSEDQQGLLDLLMRCGLEATHVRAS